MKTKTSISCWPLLLGLAVTALVLTSACSVALAQTNQETQKAEGREFPPNRAPAAVQLNPAPTQQTQSASTASSIGQSSSGVQRSNAPAAGIADTPQIRMAKKALEANEQFFGPDDSAVTKSLGYLGMLYRQAGRYAEAESVLNRALQIQESRQQPDNADLAATLNELGGLYSDTGNYVKAQLMFQRALTIDERVQGPEHVNTAKDLNNLGLLCQRIGDYPEAERMQRRSLRIFEKVFGSEHLLVAQSLHNYGLLFEKMRDFAKAEAYYQRALSIREKRLGPQDPNIANSLYSLANLYQAMEDYSQAEPLHQRALSIRERVLGPKHADTLASLNNLAGLYFAISDYAKAEPLFQRALKIAGEVFGSEHQHTAAGLGNLGGLYSAIGDYPKGKQIVRQCLKVLEATYGPDDIKTARVVFTLASLNLRMGDYTEAESLFQRALSSREKVLGLEHPLIAYTLSDLGSLFLATNDRPKALEAATKLMQAQGKILAQMLSFTSESGRLAYQATFHPFDLVAALGEARETAQALLRYKSVVLDSLSEDRLVAQSSKNPEQRIQVDQLRSAKQRLTRLQLEVPKDFAPEAREKREAEKNKLIAEVEHLESALARHVAGLGRARRALGVTVEQVQKAIPRQTVLLELLRYSHYLGTNKFEPRYGAIVLAAAGEPKWVQLGSAEAIEKNIAAYQAAVRTDGLPKPRESVAQEGRSLRETRFTPSLTSSGSQPGKESRDAVERVLTDPGEDYARLCYLDRRDLQDLRLEPLPGTAKESAALTAQAKKGNWPANVFVGVEASEAQLAAVESPRILHLATHGFFLPDVGERETGGASERRGVGGVRPNFEPSPMGSFGGGSFESGIIGGFNRPAALKNPMHRSGLALAGAQATLEAWKRGETPPTSNDGIVTADEVGTLKLEGTELVVLSACDTGIGAIKSGEGVLGLRRGFIQAGAENLLMTLWSVSDEETAKIMADFYERFHATSNASQALADVQRDWLVKLRQGHDLPTAVKLAGPFILSSQGQP